jgi:hypothetical protein
VRFKPLGKILIDKPPDSLFLLILETPMYIESSEVGKIVWKFRRPK